MMLVFLHVLVRMYLNALDLQLLREILIKKVIQLKDYQVL